jgi:hypothetical protein
VRGKKYVANFDRQILLEHPMAAAVFRPGRLDIHRLEARYLVSSGHPSPERVKAKLDEVVVHKLREGLAVRLAALVQSADEAVWCIRRLELALDVNVAWDQEQLARAWSSQLARVMAGAIQGGSDGENVRYFANRAAYLARFVSDLAAGAAWGKWWYRRFAGLRLLPLSSAVRTALIEQPLIGQEALLLLAADERRAVLRGLSARDARWVLDAIANATPDSEEQRCFTEAWSTWQHGEMGPLDAEDEWRNALALYLWTRQKYPAIGGAALRTAARTLLCFARCLGLFQEKLFVAMTSGNIAAVYDLCGVADAETLLPLLRCLPAWTQEVGQALLARQTHRLPATTSGSAACRSTPFGGLFLLLPLLDELPLSVATQGWPEAGEIPAVTIVRFLLLIQCCGRPRAAAVFSDPLVRDLLAIPPDFSLALLADWQASITSTACDTFREVIASWRAEVLPPPNQFAHGDPRPEDLTYLTLPESFGYAPAYDAMLQEAAYVVMRTFARRLPGFAGSRLSYLYDNFLACSGSVEEEPLRRIVRLGPAPLRLVLQLTGMARTQYRLRWLDERPFVLFPEE